MSQLKREPGRRGQIRLFITFTFAILFIRLYLSWFPKFLDEAFRFDANQITIYVEDFENGVLTEEERSEFCQDIIRSYKHTWRAFALFYIYMKAQDEHWLRRNLGLEVPS